MKAGARNQIKAKVTGIQRGDVMAQIKLIASAECEMGSVVTVDSLDELDLKVGDEVVLLIKAVNVIPIII
jgi:molybdopterin-binding protein